RHSLDTLHFREVRTLVRRNTKGQLPSANIDLQPQGAFMPRGIVPRQPAKTGRQDRAADGRAGTYQSPVKTLSRRGRSAELLSKTRPARTPVRPPRTSAGSPRDQTQKAGGGSSDPLAPERSAAILK